MSVEYRITTNGQNVAPDVVQLVIDELAAIEELPNDFGIGSTAICLENSSVYMLGNDRAWHKI